MPKIKAGQTSAMPTSYTHQPTALMTPTFKISDCQQLDATSRIVSLHNGGPFVIRVHESLEAQMKGEASRYYISVDLKFRPMDALSEFGWYGCTKSEVTRAANQLGEKLWQAVRLLDLAKESTMAGKAQLVAIREKDLAKILNRYSAEIL